MALSSNKSDLFCGTHFIFRDNSIILQNGNLPDENVLKKCIDMEVASDWITETDKNFSAILLETDSPDPKGCESILLREFFYNMGQNEEGKKIASLAARAKGLLNFKAQKRYCSYCGGALKNDLSLTARTCVQCGHQFFPQIEPAIIVLVSKGDEILLAKHANRNHDFWTTLAGFVETGETIENAVKREVFEETKIKIKNVRYVSSQSWPFPDQLMLAFRAEYESGEIDVQPEEIIEASWFKRDSLPKIPGVGSVAYDLISGVFD